MSGIYSTIKSSRSISEFKRAMLQIIKSVKNSLYNISDIDGIKYLTKIRLKFSALMNTNSDINSIA